MQEQKLIKKFRIAKIIQLFLLAGIELTFFLTLLFNKSLSRQIYSNKQLFFLCAITWVLMIFSLFYLFYDFYKLRILSLEGHTLNQAAYLDSLTGIPNRHSLDIVFQTYTTPESLAGVACAMFSIENLKTINETSGHEAGDRLLQDFCNIFEEIGDNFGFIGRNGGNEFVAVIENSDHEKMEHFLTCLKNSILIYNTEHSEAPIVLRSVYTLYEEAQVQSFTQLLAVTYTKLYPTE